MFVITYTNDLDDTDCGNDFDRIEILSSQSKVTDEFFLAPIASLNESEADFLRKQEVTRKRMARVVAFVSGIFFLISVALVTVSLYLAKNIDEIVPIACFEGNGNASLDIKETKRKRIVFMVALVSGILFLASVILVTVSLYFGKDIDEKARNSNDMLRKHNDRMSAAYANGLVNATAIL